MWGSGHRTTAVERILAALLLTILPAVLHGNGARAQEAVPRSAANSFLGGITPTADVDEQADSASRKPLRVPRASGRLAQPGSAANSADSSAHGPGSSGWWLGTTGITLVLAFCGAICIAARKYLPQQSVGALRVVGRVSLSSRHSIYLIRAGERVLLIGTGSQGAPSLLGEMTEEVVTAQVAPGLDIRLGAEE